MSRACAGAPGYAKGPGRALLALLSHVADSARDIAVQGGIAVEPLGAQVAGVVINIVVGLCLGERV